MAWAVEDLRNLTISNVSDDELDLVKASLNAWNSRLEKNLKRSLYYDTEQSFKDLGIALPPQLKNARFYLGWATQAVRKAAVRSQFDGFRLPGSDDPFELDSILTQNRFALSLSQAIVSAYTHGVSFVTVAHGGPGESLVQIHGHSAEYAGAVWDSRRRRISALVTVTEVDEDKPTAFVAYLPNAILHCSRSAGKWAAERVGNPFGRALAVAITYDPQLRRPFGRSRLTNSVMALTDMAVRGYVRMEGNAEFYSSPQLALLGVDRNSFGGNLPESHKFKLAMDRLIALTKDSDGDSPTLHQLTQATMTPHSDMLRTVAMAFAGETGIPPSSLGVLHDQPASAEAIRAAEHDLLIDVTYQNNFVLAAQAQEIAHLALMVRDGLTFVPDEAWKLSAKFADPEFRSLSAKADAVQKLSATMADLSQWPVLLEEVFDQQQVERILEDRRRMSGRSTIERLAGNANQG